MNAHLANVRCPRCGRVAFEVWATPDGEVRARDDNDVIRLNGVTPETEDTIGRALNGPDHPWCHEHEVELSPRGRRLIDKAEGAPAAPLRVQGVVRHT